MKLSNKPWKVLERLFPAQQKSPKGGRPPYSTREILQGVLWLMRVGARWGDLPTPRRYPSGSSCYRYFRKWVELGILDQIIRTLFKDLKQRGKIDLTESFIDAPFVEAKKGVEKSVNLRAVMAPRSWKSLKIDLFLSPCFLRVA